MILSISSMNTIPFSSAFLIASRSTESELMRRSASWSSRIGRHSPIFIFFGCVFPPVRSPIFTTKSPKWIPPLPSCGIFGPPDTGRSTSIVRSSRAPSRSRARNDSRVEFCAASPARMSRIRFSTAATTSARTSSFILTFCSAMATSTRSLIIVSTSFPWKPTSVYLVASTLTNGAPASLARRRATSVLPTPVGPIIRMFLGMTSSLSGDSSFMRRHRLRIAMAMARLASCCPTMCLLRYATISLGVMSSSSGGGAALGVSEIVTVIGTSTSDSAVAESHRRDPKKVRGTRPDARGSCVAAIRCAADGAAVAALRAACVSLCIAETRGRVFQAMEALTGSGKAVRGALVATELGLFS
mmetsp:Transcript_58459/g.139075  ORF Transcript_58459/g.139075 Transcript_58459/m.139075 type:complete len:357 (+) Transcript_58459:611-1681(+)